MPRIYNLHINVSVLEMRFEGKRVQPFEDLTQYILIYISENVLNSCRYVKGAVGGLSGCVGLYVA